jgi:hypothetical protein
MSSLVASAPFGGPGSLRRFSVEEHHRMIEAGILHDILRHTARGYPATRKQDGRLKSTVFGRSFRLLPRKDRGGLQTWKLELR